MFRNIRFHILLTVFVSMNVFSGYCAFGTVSIEDLIAADGELDIDSHCKELFNKAVSCYKAGNIEEAFHYGGLAYKKDPRILLTDDQGMIGAMEEYLHEKTLKAPDDPTGYYRYAKLLALRNKVPQAVAALKKVVNLSPDSVLGKKSADLLRNAPIQGNQNTGSGQIDPSSNDSQTLSYEEEYAKLTSKTEQLRQKNAELKDKISRARARNDEESALLQERNRTIEKMKKENKTTNIYSTLFWANPTNVWYLNNNYSAPEENTKRYPEYYKAKEAERQARNDYYKSFHSPGSN